MTRRWTTGFELGNPANDLTTFTGATLAAGLLSGAYGIRIGGNGQLWSKTIPELSEFYYATHYKSVLAQAGGALEHVVQWRKGSTVLGAIGLPNATALWNAEVGNTVVLTGATTYAWDTWVRLDIYVKVADSGGRIKLWVDGVLVVDYTGDTKPGADTVVDNLYCTAFYYNCDYDNMSLNDVAGSAPDNGRIGEGRIIALMPNAAGTYAEWTPSAGSNYENANERPSDGDTTYNATATNAKRDSYNLAACGLSNVAITRVWVELTAKRSAAGTNQIAPILISGATETIDTAQDLTAAYARHVSADYMTNPNTAGDSWTPTTLDALEAGAKAVI